MACYEKIECWRGPGTDQGTEREKRVALKYIVGPGTDQGTEREKRVGEMYIFSLFFTRKSQGVL